MYMIYYPYRVCVRKDHQRGRYCNAHLSNPGFGDTQHDEGEDVTSIGCYKGGVASADLKRCQKTCETTSSSTTGRWPMRKTETDTDSRTCYVRVAGYYTKSKDLKQSIAAMEEECPICSKQCKGDMFDFGNARGTTSLNA